MHWFRRYSSLAVVVSGAFLVTGTNLTADDGLGVATGYFRSPQEQSEVAKRRNQLAMEQGSNLSYAPLVDTVNAVDPESRDSGNLPAISPAHDFFVAAAQASAVREDPEEDGGVTIYTVESGDTVSQIAAAHNVTINTILWANDLDNVDSIKPGDKIFILPVAGLSHTVKSGETIESIASQFKADKDRIIAFNELPANGRLDEGQTIIIPGGQKEAPRPADDSLVSRRQYATGDSGTTTGATAGWRKLEGKAGTGHRFPYGYCTWYIAQRRYVPWGGNAGTWLYNAKALGYKTGKAPAKGAIVVTTDSARYGHVALVEKVGDGTITVSEMNYKAWGKTNTRVIPVSSRSIRGYIY